MKKGIIEAYSLFNKLWLKLNFGKRNFFGGIFSRVRVHTNNNNCINITTSETIKTTINLSGDNNVFQASHAYISDSLISISGKNNALSIGEKVSLRSSNIIIRGEGCRIAIGRETTFGGVRLVNVGKNNLITIGEECLFSDNIEIWASDTHPIYNSENELINKEKPICIGNKVWVGSRVIILKGVTINNGSIIGMGTVVTKDVPDMAISAGFPNKTVKENIRWSRHYNKY